MLKIYIADDSVVVRSKLTDALEENAAIKVIGNSGDTEQAVMEINSLDPQVVIIDIRMPGGGGLPLLHHIKTYKNEMITIILTSFPYDEYRETYLTSGADFFYDKAKDIPQMIKILNDLAKKDGG